MIEYLRERRISASRRRHLGEESRWRRARLPASARTRSLVEGLSPETIAGLEALADRRRRPRTHAARLAAGMAGSATPEKSCSRSSNGSKPCASSASEPIAKSAFTARAMRRSREKSPFSVPRDISRFDAPRRLATLVVFAREMEVALTDAALAMFDKMLGAVFRRADRAHKDNVVDRAKTLDASARALLGMAKAMLAAKENGEDQVAAVERALGWERLKTLVARDRSRPSSDTRGRQSRRDRRALCERTTYVAGHPRRFRLPILEGARSVARRARRGARASCERREETSAAGADGVSAANMAQARQEPARTSIAAPMRSRS